MIHIKKDRCGYSSYSCIGITPIPVLTPPICDNTNYDQQQIQRQNDNNFLNLPANFKSVVQNVPFIDLGRDAVWDETKCVTEYQPLQGGLFDAFSYLQTNTEFIEKSGDYSAALQCYSDNNTQYPGILLPLKDLSLFSAVQLQAVPTAALAPTAQTVDYNRGIETGCSGFKVTAKITGSYKIKFSVSLGYVYMSTAQDGSPQELKVTGISQKVCKGKSNVQGIQIYLIVGFDFNTGNWKGVVYSPQAEIDDSSDGLPTKWLKQTLLATIKYVNRYTVDVIQSQCSPVDLRDWVSQVQLPDDSGNYVFMYKGNSTEKGWVQVKDCN